VSRYVGIDFGRNFDRTAVAVLDVVSQDLDEVTGKRPPARLWVNYLHRLPPRLPYPAQVSWIANFMDAQELRGASLAVDATGVGVAVVDLLRLEIRQGFHELSITGGNAATSEGTRHSVPKRDLVSRLSVAMQSRRLQVRADLPLATELLGELERFEVTINESGRDSYGAGTGHDDLVLALSYAVWMAERGGSARAWIDFAAAQGRPVPRTDWRAIAAGMKGPRLAPPTAAGPGALQAARNEQFRQQGGV
jgi:hypothetical protein